MRLPRTVANFLHSAIRSRLGFAICLLTLLVGTKPVASAATVIDFDFSGVDGTVVQTKATFELTATTTVDADLDIVQGVNIFAPSSLDFSTGGGSSSSDMNLREWGATPDTTLPQAIAGNNYVSYTIAPQAGNLLQLNGATFAFTFRRNGTNAPQNYFLVVNPDGTTLRASQQVASLTVTDTVSHIISGSLPAGYLDALIGPVEVRLYANDAPNVSGNTHISAASITNGEVATMEEAGVVLTTDFGGRTISDATASNITWAANGVIAPSSSLTVMNEAPGSLPSPALFSTSDAVGHFAVDKNIENEGPWSVTIEDLALDIPGGSQLALESVVLDWQHFNNSGNFQASVGHVADWTITVTGSVDGLLATASASTSSATSGILEVPFASLLLLNDDQTYDIKLSVSSSGGSGNNTGLSAFSLMGSIVPEPETYGLRNREKIT